MNGRTPEYDKSKWGGDQWKGEPDRKEWRDEATGMPCLALRNMMGAWCGYVGVAPTHPAHGLHYDGAPDDKAEAYSEAAQKRMKIAMQLTRGGADFSDAMTKAWEGMPDRPEPTEAGAALPSMKVHGGLTYAGKNDTYIGTESTPDFWWFGFDTAHAYDFTPGLAGSIVSADYRRRTEREDTYRDLAYVEKECASLAEQLHAMTKRLSAPEEA